MSELPPEPPPAEPEVTTAAALEPGADHPLRLIVTDDLKRSRLTVFFRLLLAIPHFIWLTLWTIAAFFVVIVAWFAALIKGRLPDGMHGFLASYLRYSTRLNAYLYLLANPYPPFNGSTDVAYPVDLHVDPPQDQQPLDDPPAVHPGDPGPDLGVGLRPGARDRRVPRLVRLPLHRGGCRRGCATWASTASATSSRPTGT